MEGQKEYIIRKITNKRILRGEVEYFVSWEGYPESEDSWEPKSGLTDAMEAIYEYERSLLKNEARSSPTASEPVEDAPSPYKVRRSFERGSWRFGVGLHSVPDKMEQERLQLSSKTSKNAPSCESTDESTDRANNDCAEVTKRHKRRRRSKEQQPPPVPAYTSASMTKADPTVVPLAVFKSPFDASTRDRQPQNRKRPHKELTGVSKKTNR